MKYQETDSLQAITIEALLSMIAGPLSDHIFGEHDVYMQFLNDIGHLFADYTNMDLRDVEFRPEYDGEGNYILWYDIIPDDWNVFSLVKKLQEEADVTES